MSVSFFNANIIGPIKRALLDNESTRKAANTNYGQILSLSEAQIKDIHKSLGLSDADSNEVWNFLHSELNKMEAAVASTDKNRYALLKNFINVNNIPHARIITRHIGKVQTNKSGTSYLGMSSLKTAWIDKLAKITGRTDLTNFYHLGHGIMGNAVSELTALRGIVGVSRSSIEKSKGGKFVPKEDIAEILEKQRNLIADIFSAINFSKQVLTSRTQLEVSTDMRVDSEGQLNKDYVFVLTFQSSESNLKDSKREKEQIEAINKLIKDKYSDGREFFKDSGSASLEEAVEGVIHYSINSKNAKVTGPKGRRKYTSNHHAKETTATSTEEIVVSKFGRIPKPPRMTNKVASKPSKVNIVALLNTKLPQEIRSRMTYPRLVNRTGRFSESVQVLSADTTAKGGTSFAYTYQKDPYQLFERGRSRLATPDREPRDIIDASIRSIAQEMMLGRFYTRRV